MAASPAASLAREPERFAYIDALRGIAILLVIVVHGQQRCDVSQLPAWLVTLCNSGARGVQLFYVVSAFTLFHSLHERARRERRPIANFFIRRFFRIAPLFWLAMAFFLWHDGRGPRYFLGDAERVSDANIAATALFVNGWNPYWITSIVPGGWSVAIEMTFYLTIPLWYFLIRSGRAAWVFALVGTLAAVLLNRWLLAYPWILYQPLWYNFVQLWFFNQLPAFFLGIVTYFLLHSHLHASDGEADPRADWRRDGLLMIAASVVLFPLLAFETTSVIPTPATYGLIFLLLVVGLARFPLRFFVNPLFRFFGMISYSAYLSHVAVLKFVGPIVRNSLVGTAEKSGFVLPEPIVLVAVLVSGAAGIAVVSYATYRLIEQPSIHAGRLLIRRLERGPARAASAASVAASSLS